MKISLKNEIFLSKDLLMKVLILFGVLYFFNLSIWFDGIAIILITFPTIYLHLKYSYNDKNKTLIINQNNIFLEINDKIIDLRSTDKIVIRGSVGLTRNIIPILISPSYYEVIFKSKEFGEVSVSSLIEPNVREVILDLFDNKMVSYDYFIIY